MKKLKYIKLIILLFFCSCKFISFEQLELYCNIPEDIIFFDKEYIIIEFSISPDKELFEKHFQLLQGNTSVNLTFLWEDKKCFIKPELKWNNGFLYTINFSDSILTNDGRTYDVVLKRLFYYGQESKLLKLDNCSIKDNSIIYGDSVLSFEFNNSIDTLSFVSNFSITPSISYDIEFINDNEIVNIITKNKWETNTIYKWKLENIISKEEYPLIKSYEGIFFAPIDMMQPFVKKITPVSGMDQSYLWKDNSDINTDMFTNNCIGFEFSEEIEFETLKNAISFTPSIDGYLIKDEYSENKYIWVIEEFWKQNTEYQLTISKNVEDLNGLNMYEDYICYFTVQPTLLKINSVDFNSSLTIEDFSETFYTVDDNSNNEIYITIKISNPIDEEYKSTFIDYISLNTFFPSTAMPPTVFSYIWINNSELILSCKDFTKSTSDNYNYYLLKILGDKTNILNCNGVYFEDEICIYFVVE